MSNADRELAWGLATIVLVVAAAASIVVGVRYGDCGWLFLLALVLVSAALGFAAVDWKRWWLLTATGLFVAGLLAVVVRAGYERANQEVHENRTQVVATAQAQFDN